MSDPRLTQAFRDLDQIVPTGRLEPERLNTAISTAQRARVRRRALTAVVGAAAVGLTGVFLIARPTDRVTLIPAQVDPTPTAPPFTRGGAQPGMINYLPRGSATADARPQNGVTHYQTFFVPGSHAERRAQNTPGDLIELAIAYKPDLPSGSPSGQGATLQLAHTTGQYFAPSGEYNLAAIVWFDGLFNYRLQAPAQDQAHPLGLTYAEFVRVANSVDQGTPALPSSAFSPLPKPRGYLQHPGPDVLAYWGPYFYAKRPPTDAHPKITAAQALTTERSQSHGGSSHGSQKPDEYLALVSLISPNPEGDQSSGRSTSYRDRLAWVISFGGINTDDTQGHNYTGCTDLYIVDASSGKPFNDGTVCQPRPKATPTRQP